MPNYNSKMVLEPRSKSVGSPAIKFPLSGHPPFYFHTLSPIVLAVRGVLGISNQTIYGLNLCLGEILTSQDGLLGEDCCHLYTYIQAIYFKLCFLNMNSKLHEINRRYYLVYLLRLLHIKYIFNY